MEELIKIAEEQIEILKKAQDLYDELFIINASKEIREWSCLKERCIALIQKEKIIQEMKEQMKEQMKEIKPIKNMDIEELSTKLNDVKVSEVIDQVTKHMKENMECKGAL